MNIRGEGWQADCPKCVASKFTCDEHQIECPPSPFGRHQVADALAMAAAPAMLEALDFMVNVSRSTPGFSAMAREQAERAIALAKGAK